MEENYYGEIIVNNKTKATDQLFTYHIPSKFIKKVNIGSKVIVPFGRGNILLEGYILNITRESDYKNLKDIKYVLDDNAKLTNSQISLCKWLRDTYLCTYYDAIQCIVPPGTTLKKKKMLFVNYDFYDNFKRADKLTEEEIQITNFILNKDGVAKNDLKKINKFETSKNIEKLIKDNILYLDYKFYEEASIKYKKVVRANLSKEELPLISKKFLSRAPKQIKILEILLKKGDLDLKELIEISETSSSVIKALEKKDLVRILDVEDYRSPLKNDISTLDSSVILNEEQQLAYMNIMDSIKKEEYKGYLIHGITGSGKTEVYIKLVESIIKLNKQAIILVPEISLTPQIVKKFAQRFGKGVAVLHSKLSLGERYDQWRKIKSNEISIVIGARSAVFAPCNNLGLIIIDEEHEASYKSEMHPKYHTIEVAEHRLKQNKGILVLGSATPSIDSYYKAQKKELGLIQLRKRFNKNPLPSVETVDMREELAVGNRTILSNKLYDYMKESLSNNKQVILFLNRRGYSTFISCRSCGHVIKCSNCDISLTYHHNNDIAKCHYCGYYIKTPKICPNCSSKYIRHFGTGTEKVEEFVKKLFPNKNIGRLDVDTTSRKGELEKIIKAFEKRETDILIGTQMIAKGLDFPYVTLVGVLSADITLNLPDYRSNERTFQLLTQVAGRAGRHNYRGRVVIQTYTPDNYSIIASQSHDFSDFYETEIKLRKEFYYPPFCKIANIIIFSSDEKSVVKSANVIFQQIKSILGKAQGKIQLLGPSPAIHNKIKGSYRWQILIKHENVDHNFIKGIINNICNTNKNKAIDRRVNITFDLNSYNTF